VPNATALAYAIDLIRSLDDNVTAQETLAAALRVAGVRSLLQPLINALLKALLRLY
jgi:hypothetical protein